MHMATAPENPSPFTPSALSDFLSGLASEAAADGQQRLKQGAGHFAYLAENPTFPITPAQRQEVRRLCAHPLLPKRDKTLNLVNYMQDNQEQAADRIRQLQSQISLLEDMRDAA
jgi:hypothetical protein